MTNKELFKKVYDKLGITGRAEKGLITFEDKEIIEAFIKIDKDLEVLEILKKYCLGDGWSNGYLIHFWEMNDNELKKVKELLNNEEIH